MKMFTKNAIMAAVGLSLAGIAGAYDLVGGFNPAGGNAAKDIDWRYHDCVMTEPDGTPVKTGSKGDNGDAYFAYRQGGEVPITGRSTAAPCYSPTFDTAQSPLTAPPTLDLLVPRIAATLPESRHIDRSNIVLGEDDSHNIYVAPGKEVEVWATFMDEGAGYENSVGFFTWEGKNGSANNNKPVRHAEGYPVLADGSDLLKTERIFFPRASTTFPLPRVSTSGANKGTGTTVYLGKFNGGADGLGIGFVIAANAWKGSGVRNTTMTNKSGVDPKRDKSWIFYSVRGLNPECSLYPVGACGDRDKHTVMLFDEEVDSTTGSHKYHRMILGLEDIRRNGGDHDFNDVLLALHVKELTPGAIANSEGLKSNKLAEVILDEEGKPVLIDSDGDDVPDSLDEFPNDKDRAFSRYYPGKTTWGTLAYEDLWPQEGDFDFNDMLIRYRTREILNAQREVRELEVELRLDAAGAGYKNGFAINLPSIPSDRIASAKLEGSKRISFAHTPIVFNETAASQHVAYKVNIEPLRTGVVGGQNGSVFEIFKDATLLLTSDNGDKNNTAVSTPGCSQQQLGGPTPEPGFRNTGFNCAIAPPAEFKLTVKFKSSQKSFPLPPYDPFLFRAEHKPNATPSSDAFLITGDKVEVHLPGKLPTSRANTSLFGTFNDRTNTSTSNTYLSDKDQPWALDIPIEWDYPYEKLDLRTPYPNFIPWAASKGTTHKNWYAIPPVGNATFRANAASSD
jgi:LruC domain-containing protein